MWDIQKKYLMSEQQIYSNYQQLFRAHYTDLCRYAYKYLRDKQQSEDVVQDCFIRFWEIKKEMSGEKHAVYYLTTSVKNKCITVLRNKIHVVSVESFPSLEADNDADPKENINAHELIKQALDLLPPKCGLVFKMSRIEKMTYKEIAAQLEISVKTVENQMGKAISILRQFASRHNVAYSTLIFYILLYASRGFDFFIV